MVLSFWFNLLVSYRVGDGDGLGPLERTSTTMCIEGDFCSGPVQTGIQKHDRGWSVQEHERNRFGIRGLRRPCSERAVLYFTVGADVAGGNRDSQMMVEQFAADA